MTTLTNTWMTKHRFKPLNEAEESKYGLPDEAISGISENEEDNTNINSQEETPAADSEEVSSSENPVAEPYDTSSSDTDAYSSDDISSDGDITEDEIDSEAKSTPGLRLLSSISDEQYRLCNIKLHKKFIELTEDVRNTINNTIMNIITINSRQRQAIDITHNNLISMIDDITNYVMYNFGNTYESNVIAYVTFLKRYQIAMNIINIVISENSRNNSK